MGGPSTWPQVKEASLADILAGNFHSSFVFNLQICFNEYVL